MGQCTRGWDCRFADETVVEVAKGALSAERVEQYLHDYVDKVGEVGMPSCSDRAVCGRGGQVDAALALEDAGENERGLASDDVVLGAAHEDPQFGPLFHPARLFSMTFYMPAEVAVERDT